MGYCIPIISFLSGIYVSIWTFLPGLIFHLSGISLQLAGLIGSSVVLYLYTKFLGKIGGIILIAIGIIGAFFSAGTTLAISAVGLVLTLVGGAGGFVVIGNILVFALAIICSI